ncbi:MAG: hypothetical protein KIT84_10385 [Labilithrix sp.]|nr:hypothetical protein [Labilithrix sp.]MCW5811412.1 hypothetical protein [Labilithrix sp.]
MKISLLPSLVLASVLSLSAFGCAANSGDDAGATAAEQEVRTAAREVKATTEARFGWLNGVWNVRGVDNEAGIDLSIIEAGGGDPALNGNHLFLSAYGPDHGGGGVFELGLNISELTGVEMVGDTTLKLTGTYDDIIGEDGDITGGHPFEALVKLTMNANDVQESLTVTRAGHTETVKASTEEGIQFFSSIFEVKQKETKEGTIVRLFDTGKGGDPAMNGGQLLLSIMSWPEEKTYDLGLNILSVTKFEVPNESTALIEGSEHYMDAQGEIKTRPYSYKLDFSLKDGEPAETIKLQRLL